VTGDTQIFIQRKDRVIWKGPIRDYIYEEGDFTLSIDPLTKSPAWMPVTAKVEHKNDKQLLRVETESGRHVHLTEDHSLVTIADDGGFLQPLYPKDCVIGRTRLPVTGFVNNTPAFEEEIEYETNLGILAGLYLSEGCFGNGRRNLKRLLAKVIGHLLLSIFLYHQKKLARISMERFQEVLLHIFIRQHILAQLRSIALSRLGVGFVSGCGQDLRLCGTRW
jgi:hypothetical protein